jgi:hypothetical protein
MPMKGSGTAADYRVVDRWDGGVGWIAYPDERMQRASHALATDAGVWVCDPVDVPDLDDLLAEFGEVRGVVVQLDRHLRDAATVANRHDVAVYVPEWFDGVEADLDAPTERLGGRLPDTGYEVRQVVDNRAWQEAALWDGETLVVPEAVGTVEYFTTGQRRLGIHPALRLKPPRRALGSFSPGRVLCGHGAGIEEGAATALEEALSWGRRTAPRLYAEALAGLLFG